MSYDPSIEIDEASVQADITSMLLKLRKVRGPKLKRDLALLIRISPESLSHTLSPSGRGRLWQVHDVVNIADYYRISTDALMGRSPAREDLIAELRAEAAASIDDDAW
jgi:hypothetical protein